MSPAFRPFAEPDLAAANRQTASLGALAVTLLLVVVALYLVDKLRAEAAFENCVLAGRVGCVVSLTQ
jgi:flagellar biogenesis protein FliO